MNFGTTSSDSALSIRMFGPFEVRIGGVPIPKLRSRKGQWLLALLVLREGQTVDRRWLAGCLWPDHSEAQAYTSLRQSLADLRRALGGETGRIETPTAYTLRFEPAGVEVDVRTFDALIARSDTEALGRAVSLYRGPLLEGCTEEWVFSERQARSQSYLQALDVPGEMVWLVSSLETPRPERVWPNDKQPPSALLEYDAVRLFVNRILTQCPDFALTWQNAPSVLRICHCLEGIPLALELAAARTKTLPVDQIADRLDDCFRLLTGGRRTAMPRHRTLGALIDWSYHLLSAPQQALLRHLSIFAGGWPLEAAEAVCGEEGMESDVLDLLTALVDKSLVLVEEVGRRFRLLETIRQYAWARLHEANEADILIDRRLRFFVDFVERDAPRVGAHGSDWIDRLASDHANFRATLDEAPRHEEGARMALRMATGLWRYCQEERYLQDGMRWLNRALENPETDKIRTIDGHRSDGLPGGAGGDRAGDGGVGISDGFGPSYRHAAAGARGF